MSTKTALVTILTSYTASYTGICSSPFKVPGSFGIALPVCLVWRTHMPTAQLSMSAACNKHTPAWITGEGVNLLGLWGEETVNLWLGLWKKS